MKPPFKRTVLTRFVLNLDGLCVGDSLTTIVDLFDF